MYQIAILLRQSLMTFRRTIADVCGYSDHTQQNGPSTTAHSRYYIEMYFARPTFVEYTHHHLIMDGMVPFTRFHHT